MPACGLLTGHPIFFQALAQNVSSLPIPFNLINHFGITVTHGDNAGDLDCGKNAVIIVAF